MTKYNELVDHLVSTMKTNSPEQTNNNSGLDSYIKEIETQANKPLTEQLNDVKIAGAKLILSLDKIGKQLDKIVKDN